MDQENSRSLERRRAALVAIVALVAALARIAACWYWWPELSGDPDGYLGLASRLAAGDGFATPAGNPTAYRPILYSLLLAGVVWAGPIGVALLHIALGVGTVLLTVFLGRRLGLGAASPLAGLFVAINPMLLRYAPQVMTETTCAFLTALLLATFAARNKIVQRNAGSGRRVGGPASFCLGIVLGLAILSRPTFWGVAGLMGLDAVARRCWHTLLRRRCQASDAPEAVGRRLGRGSGLRAVGVLLGLVLVVAPWVVRNALVLGSPRLATTHGGYTLLLANNPVFWKEVVLGPPGATWGGESLSRWQGMLEEKMAAAGIDPTDEIARDRWMRHRAIDNIVSSPVVFLRATAYRLGRFWAIRPLRPAQSQTSQVVRTVAALYFAGLFLLAALGLFGWLWGQPASPRSNHFGQTHAVPSNAVSWRGVLWLVLGFVIVHAFFWTDARMRAPIVPAVAILAAFGAGGTLKILRARWGRNSS